MKHFVFHSLWQRFDSFSFSVILSAATRNEESENRFYHSTYVPFRMTRLPWRLPWEELSTIVDWGGENISLFLTPHIHRKRSPFSRGRRQHILHTFYNSSATQGKALQIVSATRSNRGANARNHARNACKSLCISPQFTPVARDNSRAHLGAMH